MLNFIASWRREREAIRELSRLSDRELADLGVARADIKAIAAGAPFMTRDDVAAAVAPVTALRAANNAGVSGPSWAAAPATSIAA